MVTYARPGVEAACLTLQDEHGQCVPLLLWRLWTLAQARPVDDALLADAAGAARAWDEAAAAPLRSLRRRLKLRLPWVSRDAREAVRHDVKAAELGAERVQLETLEALTPAPADRLAKAAAGPALAAVCTAWGTPADTQALERLCLAAV